MVQLLQREQHRIQRFAQPLLGDNLRVGAQHFTKRDTPVIAHRHIGGSIAFPEPENFYQPRMRELRQHASFVDKARQTGIERFAVFLRANLHGARCRAAGECGGQIFLDRHNAIKARVAGAVDDTEPAFANHARDLELA